MEKTITENINALNSINIKETDKTSNNNLIYIKDKSGVYIVNPFVDINEKLLEINNCTFLLLSKKNIAVKEIRKNLFKYITKI
jgi:hypothetical protein